MTAAPEPVAAAEPVSEHPSSLPAQELRRRALGGVVAVALRSFVIRGMSFAANIVLARELTPRDFGLMAFGLSIVAIGSFFTSGGIGAALIRQEHDPTRRQLEAVFGTQLTVATASAVLALAIGAQFGTAGLLAAMMTFSIPLDICRVPAAITTQRQLLFAPVIRAEIGEMVAYNVVAIVLVLLGAGIWGVGIAVLCRALTGSTLLVATSPVGLVRPRWSLPEMKPLLRFGVTLQGVQLVNMAREQGLNFATAGLGGIAALGQFNFSLRLLQPITLLFSAVGSVAFPAVAGLLRAGEDPRPMLEKGIRLAFSATGLGVVALASATPAIVPSVFGPQWDEAIAVLPWSLAGLFLSSPIVACTSAYLNATGEAGVVLRSTILWSTAWILVSVPLLPVLGAVAVGVGWTVAGLVDAAYLTRALRTRVPVRVVGNALPPFAFAVVAAPVGWLVEGRMGPTLPAAIVAGLLAAGLYLALLFAFRRETLFELGRVAGRMVLRRG
jgi:O-antigen/teichoic acid export membrane protein